MKLFVFPTIALALVAHSQASILTFQRSGNTSLITSDFEGATPYGNRINATSQGNFLYDISNGVTPNVAMSYAGSSGIQPSGWTAGYGDLSLVLWGSGPSSGLNEVSLTFTADPGFLVEFRGLDVARWSTGTYPGSYVTLTDASNVTTTLLSATELSSGNHLSLDYGVPFVSSSFTLTFGQGWWTAIDNVSFTQAPVPEPASMLVLAAGVGAAIRRRRRK